MLFSELRNGNVELSANEPHMQHTCFAVHENKREKENGKRKQRANQTTMINAIMNREIVISAPKKTTTTTTTAAAVTYKRDLTYLCII